jgi:hypothetical protein
VAKAKAPAPKVGGPSQDLTPRGNLPDASVIPEWRQFGYGAEGPAAPKPAPKKPGGKYAGGRIKKMAEGGMTDEEKYGKVGAEIRRLDPEAYKNRKDRSAEANLRLLKELREKSRGTRNEMPTSSGARSGGRGSKPGSARVGSGRYDDPTSSYGERVTAPLRAFSDIFGRRREEGVMKNMGVDRVEAARRLANLDKVRKSEGMKHGGDVKKYAKGGVTYSMGGNVSKRADGIAKKGRTRCKMV